MSEIHRAFVEKLNAIEKKREEKDQILTNIKTAFGSFNTHKKEINTLKKQDQETNLMKHRRI